MDEKKAAPAPELNPLRWFPELWESSRKRVRPQARLLGLSLAVGVIAGVGAILFFVACQLVFHLAMSDAAGYHPSEPSGEKPLFSGPESNPRPWMLLIVPTVGGLLCGWIVYSFAPEAEGHGTDTAIGAYHYQSGHIRGRVSIIKLIASAVTLGTGGSGGREGPIALIGAGFGSYLGEKLKLRAPERRVLMAAGMGAGIAAIFRAPLAGALFASEVLYRSPDFESEVIIPATLACVTAYSTFGLAFGWEPLFTIPPATREALQFNNPVELLSYLLLALCMVGLATVYVRTFYGLTYVFHRLPTRPHFRPAIGAAATGVVALLLYFVFGRDERLLSVLSFGYGVLQDALTMAPRGDSRLEFGLLLIAVALGKLLTTSLTIGSGGSGGVFGPSMVIGGCAGGGLGVLLHEAVPKFVPQPAAFVVVGMAGFFAAAAKTPLSTLVMVSEITGNYSLLVPTLWVCAIAFIVSDNNSIYSSQIDRRSLSPAHQGEYVREVLGDLRIRSLIVHDDHLLRANDRWQVVVAHLSDAPFQTLPVVDAGGHLLGVVSLDEVHIASQSPHIQDWMVAEDMMRADVAPLVPDDRLDHALELFVETGLNSLPVIEQVGDRRLVGMVRRMDVSKLYLRYVQGSPGAAGGG